MKNIILPALLGTAALLTLSPAPAATRVATYAEAEAKSLLNDDGIIVFAYADGWDKFSKKRCEKLMAHTAILSAAGKAVLLPLPIPEYTTDDSKKKMAELCGTLKVPDANSYPALIFLDAKGKGYAILCGATVTNGQFAEVAQLIADRMAKGRERARLLAAAESAQGAEKARLTYDAYQIDGLMGFGKGFGGHIAKLDPKDETGAKRAANYDHDGLINTLDKLPADQIAAEVDKRLADPAYSNRQKQKMCVAAMGVLRRNAGPAGAADLRRFALRAKELAPNSPEGLAADRVLREWVRPLTYEEGWRPDTLPVNTSPVELEGQLPIREAGTYTVQFDYTKGSQALSILAVELYDGKEKVAEDRHKGETGHRTRNNVYTLKVDKELREPHLFISVDMKKRDSRGTITIQKQ